MPVQPSDRSVPPDTGPAPSSQTAPESGDPEKNAVTPLLSFALRAGKRCIGLLLVLAVLFPLASALLAPRLVGEVYTVPLSRYGSIPDSDIPAFHRTDSLCAAGLSMHLEADVDDILFIPRMSDSRIPQSFSYLGPQGFRWDCTAGADSTVALTTETGEAVGLFTGRFGAETDGLTDLTVFRVRHGTANPGNSAHSRRDAPASGESVGFAPRIERKEIKIRLLTNQ